MKLNLLSIMVVLVFGAKMSYGFPRNKVRCPLLEGVPVFPMADPKQCDKFHFCDNGFITSTFLCNDGLAFDGRGCSLLRHVNCGKRHVLQEPKGSGSCARRYGRYPIQGECNVFLECYDNLPLKLECPAFTIYNDAKGTCIRPDHSTPQKCNVDVQYEFKCPISFGERLFRATDDCRAFYVCRQPFYVPILGGCEFGSVFNEVEQRCDRPENVQGCQNYYQDGAPPSDARFSGIFSKSSEPDVLERDSDTSSSDSKTPTNSEAPAISEISSESPTDSEIPDDSKNRTNSETPTDSETHSADLETPLINSEISEADYENPEIVEEEPVNPESEHLEPDPNEIENDPLTPESPEYRFLIPNSSIDPNDFQEGIGIPSW